MLDRLKKLREKAGVSQKALAEHIGVSQQSINKYENHNIEPDIATLIRIADFFDTSVDYIVGHCNFDHRIEELRSCDLNEEEYALIQSYNKLKSKQKQSVLLVIENYLEKSF